MPTSVRKTFLRTYAPRWQLLVAFGILGTFCVQYGWFHWYETPIGGMAWWIYVVSSYMIGCNVLRCVSWLQGPWIFHYMGFLFAHLYVFLLSGWKSSGTYTGGWWIDSYGHGQFFFVTMLLLLHLLLPYIRLMRTRGLRVLTFVGLTLACFGLGSLWELIEYRYDIDIGRHIHLLAQEGNDDTMGDLIANGIGLLLAASSRSLYGFRWKRVHPSESVQDDEDIVRIRSLMSDIHAIWEEIRSIIEAMRKRHSVRILWVNKLRELHERTGKIIESFSRE